MTLGCLVTDYDNFPFNDRLLLSNSIIIIKLFAVYQKTNIYIIIIFIITYDYKKLFIID